MKQLNSYILKFAHSDFIYNVPSSKLIILPAECIVFSLLYFFLLLGWFLGCLH